MKFLGSIFLIMGTAIGAGMITLPTQSALGSFTVTAALYVFVWFLTAITSLYTLEARCHCPSGSNFLSMVQTVLGGKWSWLTVVTYLLLVDTLVAAYLGACNAFFQNFLNPTLPEGLQFSQMLSACLIAGLVSCVLYFGMSLVEKLNRFFVIGLFSILALLFIKMIPESQSLSTAGSLSQIPTTSAVLMTSFGYGVIVPGIMNYIENRRDVRLAILLGSLFVLAIYLIWTALVFSVLPAEGSFSLAQLITQQDNGTLIASALTDALGHSSIGAIFRNFSVFAVITSLLGVSISLFEFITDSLQKIGASKNRLIALALTVLPPFLISVLFPNSFVKIISIAGILVAILHGIIPARMVWVLRQRNQIKITEKASILLVSLFFIAMIISEAFRAF